MIKLAKAEELIYWAKLRFKLRQSRCNSVLLTIALFNTHTHTHTVEYY